MVTLRCSSQTLVNELKMAALHGSIVLLSIDDSGGGSGGELSNKDRSFLCKVLQRDFKPTDREDTVCLHMMDGSTLEVKSGFQIYMVAHRTVQSVVASNGTISLSSFLEGLGIHSALDGNIVDIELQKEALQNHLHQFIVTHERPEYKIRYKSLLTDLVLHEQEKEESQEKMLNCAVDPSYSSLLQAIDLLNTIKECEVSEVEAHDQIKETRKNLKVFDEQMVVYKPLSHTASIVLASLQRLSSAVRYFNLRVDDFEGILLGLIEKFKSNRVLGHAMSIKAHVLHLKKQLLLTIYHQLQVVGQ